MRLALLLAALVGAWLVYRRRRAGDHQVVIAWEDGSEIALDHGSRERERLVGIAASALA
jgi:hypothetical protein